MFLLLDYKKLYSIMVEVFNSHGMPLKSFDVNKELTLFQEKVDHVPIQCSLKGRCIIFYL